jgi:hypothetical protein
VSIATVVTRGYATGNVQSVVVRGYGDYGGGAETDPALDSLTVAGAGPGTSQRRRKKPVDEAAIKRRRRREENDMILILTAMQMAEDYWEDECDYSE